MGNSLVDVGKLSKPATVLVEKISGAIGILYEPTRIRKKAIAEADATKTKALMDLEIEDIQKRALNRLVTEEIKKQENIENITEKSFSSLNEDAKPEDIEDDWISNFFDKCKLISDNEMQELWGKILAGESNEPGTFSKRTIEFLSTMDKSDAQIFDNLCKFTWYFAGVQPLFFEKEEIGKVFERYNLKFDTLRHLSEIGLINYEALGFAKEFKNHSSFHVSYFGRILTLNVKNMKKKNINIGNVLFPKVGNDLAKAIYPEIDSNKIVLDNYVDEYYHEVVKIMYKAEVILSEPLGNKKNFAKSI